MYDKLAAIAPTVVQSADYQDEETPWDVQLLTIGKALGLSPKASPLKSEVDDAVAAAKAAHPAWITTYCS